MTIFKYWVAVFHVINLDVSFFVLEISSLQIFDFRDFLSVWLLSLHFFPTVSGRVTWFNFEELDPGP